jgi:cell division GTPase FtsZ
VAHPDANIIFGSVIDESVGDAVRVTVIAAGFDHNASAKPATTTSAPDMTEGPRSDIFTNTTNDDFFDVGGDDDLPSFLR